MENKYKLDNSICHIGYLKNDIGEPFRFYLIDTKDLLWSIKYDPSGDYIYVSQDGHNHKENEIRKNSVPMQTTTIFQKYVGKTDGIEKIIIYIAGATGFTTTQVNKAIEYDKECADIVKELRTDGPYFVTWPRYHMIQRYMRLFKDRDRVVNYMKIKLSNCTRAMVDISFTEEEKKLPYYDNLVELSHLFYEMKEEIITQACQEFPHQEDVDKAAYRVVELYEQYCDNEPWLIGGDLRNKFIRRRAELRKRNNEAKKAGQK